MTTDAYITIAILVLTFGLLIRIKLPPVLIFLGALTLTITFRLAPLKESLKGFSNPGVLTIGALFMVAAGMYSTGAIGLEAAVTNSGLSGTKEIFNAALAFDRYKIAEPDDRRSPDGQPDRELFKKSCRIRQNQKTIKQWWLHRTGH
ncbi:MAG: hypothetical protein JSV38_11210 [Desulfobacterales bacterium]|nr:MAG: hypothetical protein JSV38_11210 [Desulfobacterales bacterium]